MGNRPLIALRDITQQYRSGSTRIKALGDVTLDIHAGEFVAIMGPSGSGKTTLMNIIGCLDRPSRGEYYYADQLVHESNPNVRARLRREEFGFVFQTYNLLPMATAQENVEMPAIYAGLRKRLRWARAEELLAGLGLSHRVGHYPSELSGGEQQRVAIARALMNGGGVLLADEPTGSVDSRSGSEIMAQLAALSERGRTIIVVSHDPSIARHAERRIELLDGRIMADTGSVSRSRISTAPEPEISPPRTQAPVLPLAENVRTALRSLRHNKFRTSLTLLGIVIGVFSVTAMLGLAEGVRREILDAISQLGGASITVLPALGEQRTLLTLDDAEAIRRRIPNLVSVTPEMSGGATLIAGARTESAQVTATTGRAMKDRGLALRQGVFFGKKHSERYAPVVILGGLLADNLFDQHVNPVGEHILLNDVPYQVIGVLKRSEARFAAFDLRARSVYVPLMTGAARLFRRDNLDMIGVMVSEGDQVRTAQEAIEALLRQRHGNAAFQIINQAEVRDVENNIRRILTLLLGGIGGISLVVAGIGVMNIMLASVAERTREIGLRMATGARPMDIRLQFVCEAVVVCVLGGAAGLLLLVGLGSVINSFGVTLVAFTTPILLTGLSCATLTGLVFGSAPAQRAADMPPVRALAAH